MGKDSVHSVLPAMHKPMERIATLHQKLARELSLAPRQVPPQSQETFWVCCRTRADRGMSEFALEERLFPRLHRFEAQFSPVRAYCLGTPGRPRRSSSTGQTSMACPVLAAYARLTRAPKGRIRIL